MVKYNTSVWTLVRISMVAGVLLLILVTAGCTSSGPTGPNTFERGDIVAPVAAPDSGAYVIVWYDRNTDMYTIDVVRKNTVTGEWWRYADEFGREQKQIKNREASTKSWLKSIKMLVQLEPPEL